MPQIYYLNPPPNPFWDFVAGLEDHPFFRGPPGGPHRHHGPPPPPPFQPSDAPGEFATSQPTSTDPELSEKAKGKQPTVEDPPEVDPSTIKPETSKAEENKVETQFPFHGRGRFAQAFNGEENGCRRGRGGHPCRGGRSRGGHNGPAPFAFGHPFFARPPWTQHDPHSPDGEHRGPPGPPGPGPHGPHGPHLHHRGPPPHHRPHGPHRRQSPPGPPRPGFDLSEFLNRLGNKLGIDLTNAAEGLGLTADRFTAGKVTQDINFEPRADIFENENLYIIHLSLPGAKKSDIGVDYDGENSVLRITGVVHRPDVDEKMLSELVVDGRKRETGVFEKAVRLGTKHDPASIDVAGISAKMTDGVLVVRIPKIEKIHQKREVPITTDAVAEGQADYDDEYSEKPILFDADEQASAAGNENIDTQKREPVDLIDMNQSQVAEKLATNQLNKAEEAHHEKEKSQDITQEEQLPEYSTQPEHEEDDWEKFSEVSGEGEYIKINVD